MNQRRTEAHSKILKILGFALLGVVLITTIYAMFEFGIPDQMNYVVNSDQKTCTVTGAKNPNTMILRIPKEIEGYTVTGIGDKAFVNHKMRIVIAPKSISNIGHSAFYNCQNLLWVNGIQECSALLKIGKFAFADCRSLLSIKLPESVEIIDECTFTNCVMLNDVSIPSNVTTIGFGAFATCTRFKQIYIPASVNAIGERAFVGCFFLSDISVDESNPCWSSLDGVLYSKDMTILYSYPGGKLSKSFVIPNGVTTIANYSFAYNLDLEVLNIPDSVVNIGDYVFADVKSQKSPLNTINYNGTIEMWNSIQKSPKWSAESPNFTIYCTDGQISKDGTVTYN